MANTIELYANNAESTLAGAITNVALSLNVSPGSGVLFPNPNNGLGQFFRLSLTDASTTLQHEIVYVTAKSTDAFTILRAQEGTTAQAWGAGDICFNGWTAGAAANAAQQSQVQLGAANYIQDTGGSANVYSGVPSPANLGTIQDGVSVRLKVAHTNLSASTLTLNGGTTYPIVGLGGQPLSGGELIANNIALFLANTTGTARYILLSCEGGAQRTDSGVVGDTRNLVMSVTAASASATVTADEIIVETVLGGLRFCLPSFSKTINLATTGAGGMDTGTAPVSGYVALYAIYNPTTGASALLATNATAAVQNNIYGGANMPSGYTASALLTVTPTNGSSQFPILYVEGRNVNIVAVSVLTTTTQNASPTSFSVSAAIPRNAKTASGSIQIVSSLTPSNLNMTVSGSSTAIGSAGYALTNSAVNGGLSTQFRGIPAITTQALFYTGTASTGTMTLSASVSGYVI